MAHRVLHQGLDQERRNHHVLDLGLHVANQLQAVLAETRQLEHEVALRLLELAAELDQVAGILKRAAVELRELAQQRAGTRGVGARERSDGVDGVEQEVRVDLALEHLGGQGRLLLERRCRHLRGQQLAEAGGDGFLGFADVAGAAIVELQRALHVLAHGQRHDDGGVDSVGALGEADLLRGEQHARLAVRQRGVCGMRADDAAGKVMRFLVAGVTQDEAVIGDGHGDGRGGGQKQAADALGGFAVQAFLAHGLKGLACQLQHVAGLASAHGVGVHKQADEHGDGQGEHNARDKQRQHADDGRYQVPDEHKAR